MRHVLADVQTVNQSRERRHHAAWSPKQAGEIAGDLFVDCTGFSSLLLGKTLGVAFKDCSDVLFCDTALAVQVPYDTPDAPMASHTISTAQIGGLDLGHRAADAPRHRLRLFQPPQQRRGGARDAAALYRARGTRT